MNLISLVVFSLLFVFNSTARSFLDNTTWTNEFGSQMSIMKAYNGTFIGNYISKVGDVNGSYKLVGTYSDLEYDSVLKITMGWSVTWVNYNKAIRSTTTWSGRVIDENTIDALWMETTALEHDIWKSTSINKDTFKKQSK